jgi:hypothetical protein
MLSSLFDCTTKSRRFTIETTVVVHLGDGNVGLTRNVSRHVSDCCSVQDGGKSYASVGVARLRDDAGSDE